MSSNDGDSVELHIVSMAMFVEALKKVRKSDEACRPRGRVIISSRFPSQVFLSRDQTKADND